MNKPDYILIGDIHGDFCRLKQICQKSPDRMHVVVGDAGIGFDQKLRHFPSNFRFFRGNHDNPAVCRAHPHYLCEYGMIDGMFVVAGASSIDKQYRTPNVDWWEDEELGYEQMQQAMAAYQQAKPTVLVAHEAPFRIHNWLAAGAVLKNPFNAGWGAPRGNRTATLLDEMITAHAPRLCVFGHWHVGVRIQLHNTLYVCLDINETLDLREYHHFFNS